MPPRKRTSRPPRAARGPADQIRIQVAALQAVLEGLHTKQGIEGVIGRFEPGVIDPGILLGIPPVVVTRPSDLMRLRFSFDNLRLLNVDGSLVLSRARANAPARLVVDHQPQHLVEEAGFEAAKTITFPTRPVHTRLSTHTRLVFSVGSVQVPWTLEGLLDACTTLPLLLAPNAQIEPGPIRRFEALPWVGAGISGALKAGSVLVKASITPTTAPGVATALGTLQRSLRAGRLLDVRVGPTDALAAFGGLHASELVAIEGLGSISAVLKNPEPKAPTDFQTSVELPWRLKLSPGPSGAWVHTTEPVDRGGRVELWHSRLARRTGTGDAAVVREADAYVRAIWARDFDQFPAALPGNTGVMPPVEGASDDPPFRKSLSSARRMKVVHESANFALTTSGGATYVPPAVRVDHLALSSLGGWLSSRFEVKTLPAGTLDLLEWEHVATMGRDHYVRTVELGFLFPFGHRATLTTITERKFNGAEPGNPAYLLKRQFIRTIDPTRTYTSNHTYVDNRKFVDAPDPVNRRLDLVMPLASVSILTRATPLLDERGPGKGGELPGLPDDFFPTVDGTPFGFRILAPDRLGNVVEYAGPLLFLSKPTNADPVKLAKAIKAYYDLTDVGQVWHQLGGQRLGYAPDTWEGQPLDTTLATQRLRWDAAADDVLKGPDDQPRFAPMLRRANVVVPSINALAGKSEALTVHYPDHYGAVGLTGNEAKVFLAVEGNPGLSFSQQADRSGGFVAPDLTITGLSGATGPIGGDLTKAVGGATNAADFFAGATANLFGIVPLSELLASLPPSGFPAFVADQVNRVTALQQDLGQIVALSEALPGRIAGMAEGGSAQATAVVDAVSVVGDHAALVLQALGSYTPGGPLAGRATDLAGSLGGLAAALDAASFLPRALRGETSTVVRRLQQHVEDVGELVDLLDAVAGGLALPETVKARMHWSTTFKAWPDPAKAVFQPRPGPGQTNATARTTLDLGVEIQAPTKPGKDPTRPCDLFALAVLVAPARHGAVHLPGRGEDRVPDGGGEEDRRQRGLRRGQPGHLRRPVDLGQHPPGLHPLRRVLRPAVPRRHDRRASRPASTCHCPTSRSVCST